MEKLPLVSIIIPSYNQGEFIEDNILSIKNQNYPDIENIIIDGASTDNTLTVIRKYEGTYNMRWISEPDDGSLAAVNKGLCKAHGDILAYLPADDLYLPWTVSAAVEYFEHHPGVEVIYGDMININLGTGRNRLVLYPHFTLPSWRRRGVLPTPAVFFRRSVVEKVGLFDESIVGDAEYWLRIGRRYRGNWFVLDLESEMGVKLSERH